MKLEDITKIYYLKNEEIKALKNVTYTFQNSKFYAIMGHSGSGKSTLIKIMGLLLKPSTGAYYLDGQNIANLCDKELSYLRMKKIGFIFQDYNLDENLRAYENVILPMLINKEIEKDEREFRAMELLEDLGIKERAYHYPKELSGGEQQRVAIARAIANNPDIILADEPTGNLDEENEKIVFGELKKLAKSGKCIVVVTHSPEALKYADKVIEISKGSLKENNG